MKRMKKVTARAQFETVQSARALNLYSSTSSILIGRRPDDDHGSHGFIGKVIEMSSGTNMLDYGIWVDLSFPHVIGIFGTRGKGKSFTLGVLIECLIQKLALTSGLFPSTAIVLLDVQNQFWTLSNSPQKDLPEDEKHLAKLEQWGLKPAAVKEEDLVLWAPCEQDDHLPDAKVFQISPQQLNVDDWLAILEQERYTPMGQALIELLKKCDDHSPGTLSKNARTATLPSIHPSTIDGLRWRLEAVEEMGLIGEPGVDPQSLLIPEKVSVMLLRNLPENMRALVAGVVARLLATRMSQHHQSRRIKRRRKNHNMDAESCMPERLWLGIDEAHVITPSEGKTPASAPLIDYVKRGRDAGMSLIFATQQPSAVDGKLMSQVDITLTHGLSFDADIQAATKRMPADSGHDYKRNGQQIPSLSGVIRTLAPGEVIVADAESCRTFIGTIRPRLTAHGGNTPPIET